MIMCRWMKLVVGGVVGGALCAWGQVAGVRESDLARRDVAIHWPKGEDPSTAAAFSHNEVMIHAGCHRVWTELTNVTAWPEWFVLVKDVMVVGGGSIQHGSVMTLKIFGSPITSRIDEFVPEERLSWIPGDSDPAKYVHYHTWHLVPEGPGCRVVTEETGTGASDRADGDKGSRLMHQAHELWLASLKWKSE